MFQNIKVNSSTDKVATNGKPYKALEVQDEAGAVFKVNVFSEFPDFANIKQGSVLRGQLVAKGQYTNLISETLGKARGGAGSTFKTAQIEKVMDTKRADISKFQDNKETSIKIASTMRMAVDLAIAEYANKNDLTSMESLIKKWRTFCWENWDFDVVNDSQPF